MQVVTVVDNTLPEAVQRMFGELSIMLASDAEIDDDSGCAMIMVRAMMSMPTGG